MSYGLTASGFVPKTLETIKADIEAALKGSLGATLKTEDASVLGVFIGIFAERFAELWDVAQAVDSGLSPSKAEGAKLEDLCSITGTLREAAKKSTVTLTATGTNGTVLASGRQVSVLGTGDKFETTASATITTVTAWAPATVYSAGARRTNAGRIYQCTIGGTSAGSGGPTTTASAITDNTVTWRYLGEGAAAVDVAAESVEADAIPAVSGSLTVIETPVSGWSSVINVLDAVPGTPLESDAALRVRRVEELAGTDGPGLDNLRAALLALEGVISCTIFENVTNVTDPDGVPPHSFETLIRGGDDYKIAETIFARKASGVRAYGSDVSEDVPDSAGNLHTIEATRPTEIPIYVSVTLTKQAGLYPSTGDADVKAAIAAQGNLLAVGFDVFSAALYQAVYKIAGVLNVSALTVGTAPSPVGSSVTITSRQLAVFDTSRVTVSASNGTP